MTEKELGQYKSLKGEISNLEKRIENLHCKELEAVPTKVKGSYSGFPYIEFHTIVWIDDPRQEADRDRMIALYKERLEKARSEALRIEQYIKDIQDSELRQIFEYRFIDGKKQCEIAELIHLDRSRVSRKIRAHLQNAHKAQKSVI